MKLAPHLRRLMGALAVSVVVGGGITPNVRAGTSGKLEQESIDVQEVVERMRMRHHGIIKNALDLKAAAVTTSGWINIRKEGLDTFDDGQRMQLQKAIQDDNKDRKTLQQIIASTHGGKEIETPLRRQFAEEWLKAAEQAQWMVFNPKFNSFKVLSHTPLANG